MNFKNIHNKKNKDNIFKEFTFIISYICIKKCSFVV